MNREEALAKLGHDGEITIAGKFVKCPAHNDGRPSLKVSEGNEGRILLKCFAGCNAGDICSSAGIELKDLMPPQKENSNNGNHIKRRLDDVYPYIDERGKLIYQVLRYIPKGFMQRKPDPDRDGEWILSTKGCRMIPFRLREILSAKEKGKIIVLCEGEKDAKNLANQGFEATATARGSGGWLDEYAKFFKGASVAIIPDNDVAGRKYARVVRKSFRDAGVAFRTITLGDIDGKGINDATDYIEAGGSLDELGERIEKAFDSEESNEDDSANEPLFDEDGGDVDAKPEPKKLTIRKMSEVIAMPRDEAENVLGDRLLGLGGKLVILGQGGIGKSRLATQLAVCICAGIPFGELHTHGMGKKWLVMQAENSNSRLADDFMALEKWLGPMDWEEIDKRIWFHTLETDDDCMISLKNKKTVQQIKDIIEEIQPDGVIWDSLYNFSLGDLNSDEGMSETIRTISECTKTGHALRMIILLHHSASGKAGAAKSVGWERVAFGRNSKALFNWARGQINVVPMDPSEPGKLVISCGKCSDGKDFPTFGLELNDETMIYETMKDFDLDAWVEEVNSKSHSKVGRKALVEESIVVSLCASGVGHDHLVKKITEETGVSWSTGKRALKDAADSKAIFKHESKWYPQL